MSVFQEVVAADGTHVTLRAAAPAATPPPRPLLAPVAPLAPLQHRRLLARRHASTYCYDFPAVFENALRAAWAAHPGGRDGGSAAALVEATELVLAEPSGSFRAAGAPLAQVVRPVGQNDVGVVAWVLTLKTPEWPHGRQIVAVANDITFGAGAFGPKEHAVFRAVCDYAVAQRMPLVYLAANSGARVGLDQQLKKLLQVRND